MVDVACVKRSIEEKMRESVSRGDVSGIFDVLAHIKATYKESEYPAGEYPQGPFVFMRNTGLQELTHEFLFASQFTINNSRSFYFVFCVHRMPDSARASADDAEGKLISIISTYFAEHGVSVPLLNPCVPLTLRCLQQKGDEYVALEMDKHYFVGIKVE